MRNIVPAAVVLLVLCLASGFARAGTPDRTRLVARPGGGWYGGYQTAGGDSGAFALFASDGADTADLGSFNGRLAGIAVRPEDGALLTLTRDGALGVHETELRELALADSRWSMLDLAVSGDEVLAVNYDGEAMFQANPDGEKSWRVGTLPIARDTHVAKAVLAVGNDGVHLLWHSRAGDLSRGSIRHAVRGDSGWREMPAVVTGISRTFAVFSGDKTLRMAVAVADPLDARPPRLVFYEWKDGMWLETPMTLSETLRARLLESGDFSCRESGGKQGWLVNALDGVRLLAVPADRPETEPGVSVLFRRDISFSQSWMVGLGLFAAFIVLLGLYCRRSRVLSRRHPGQPADFISRGVALTVDWLLVSLGMTAYHISSGDIHILEELATFEAVNMLFWINLGAFSLYAAVAEGVYGRTVGKYLTGLHVRNAGGGPASAFQAVYRNVLRCFDMFPLPIGIPGLVGLLVALWSRRKQRLGDIFAATVVLRHFPVDDRHFLLASASPRRLELMEALGVDVRAAATDIDEDAIRGATPPDTARMLAEAKASAALGALVRPREIVVAADTMVVLDGEILGKPADAADAARMLGLLSGRSHSVVTGITVWDSMTGQGMSDVEVTEVEFRDLSPREIEAYVATGDPMDKAGAYGVQSANLVKQIRGSLSNVAGLPMEKLRWMLSMLDS